jgi:hypothetical protein
VGMVIPMSSPTRCMDGRKRTALIVEDTPICRGP